MLALAFWEAVVQEERISGGFRALARGNLLALSYPYKVRCHKICPSGTQRLWRLTT